MKLKATVIFPIVFALTVFDALATWYGVSNGYIQEGNGIMRELFAISIPLTCMLVVVITGSLLYWISTKSYKWIKYAMLPVLAIKIWIAVLHITWLTLV
jgi:hypothetical protein